MATRKTETTQETKPNGDIEITTSSVLETALGRVGSTIIDTTTIKNPS